MKAILTIVVIVVVAILARVAVTQGVKTTVENTSHPTITRGEAENSFIEGCMQEAGDIEGAQTMCQCTATRVFDKYPVETLKADDMEGMKAYSGETAQACASEYYGLSQ